ncbi:hypothetical protein EFW57_02144 [Bacillus velezensis]|nr:hypothetical protein EFW57_02144 [Bacillus velezensis]
MHRKIPPLPIFLWLYIITFIEKRNRHTAFSTYKKPSIKNERQCLFKSI